MQRHPIPACASPIFYFESCRIKINISKTTKDPSLQQYQSRATILELVLADNNYDEVAYQWITSLEGESQSIVWCEENEEGGCGGGRKERRQLQVNSVLKQSCKVLSVKNSPQQSHHTN